jgi:hypothetical protein
VAVSMHKQPISRASLVGSSKHDANTKHAVLSLVQTVIMYGGCAFAQLC